MKFATLTRGPPPEQKSPLSELTCALHGSVIREDMGKPQGETEA